MNLIRDLGYGLRQIGRRPLFSLVIILTLAVGIGPNVAIFSVLKAIVLKPLPYFEPERLVQVWETDINSRTRQPFSYPDFRDAREQCESFEAFGVQSPRSRNLGGEEPERLLAVMVTADALSVWGVPPAHGRLLTEEEVEEEAKVVVISDSLWRRRFGGDPGIVGRSIPLDGDPYRVVGIMPPDFEYFTAWTPGRRIDVWAPLPVPDWANRPSHWLLAVARLKPGVSWRTAEAELRRIASTLQEEYPDSNARTQMWVLPFIAQLVGGMSAEFLILITAVGFVLLTACANVAGMLLARGADRKTEVAIRGCLGAGRRRILTQLLTESGLLSLLGGLAGVLFAFWGVDLIKAIMPPDVPRAHGIEVDSGVLLFALALTLVTGLLFGLVPAVASARTEISTTLREGSGTVTATKRRNRRLRILAVAQIAVAFMLTNGAILLYTSYREIHHIPFAFDTENVISGRIGMQGARYDSDEKRVLAWEQLLERLSSVPGVERAALTTKLPLEGGNNGTVLVEGETHDPHARRELVERSWVSPDYFEAMGIPLLAGRVFEPDEGTSEERAVVINQAFVDRYYADKEPLGQVIRPNDADPAWTATVVGVVASVPQWGPTYGALPEMYAAYRLSPSPDSFLIVRSRQAPAAVVPSIREAILEIDPNLPMSETRTMGQVLSEATSGQQFLLRLVSLFAVIALVLAMAGIFGTMSHNVAQRTREIGVRAAFGAHDRRILTLVLREGLVLDLFGIGLGFLCLFLFTAILRVQLYGVGGLNLLYVGVAVAAVALVTLAGTALPALRASRVDPMQALRVE